MTSNQKIWLGCLVLFLAGIAIGCGDSSTTVSPENSAKVHERKVKDG